MKLLAFDTATSTLGIALLDGDSCLHQHEEEGGARASDVLLPRIAQMLSQAGLCLSELDAIAFGSGPGAFTGLRTACAAAQGLALGTKLPLFPVVTLLAAAEEYRLGSIDPHAPCDLLVQLDARMGEWYWAHYAWQDAQWRTLIAPTLSTPEVMEQYAQTSYPQHRLTMNGPQLTGMVSLAQMDFQARKNVAPQDALPLYLRNKVALTIVERETLHAAKTCRGNLS